MVDQESPNSRKTYPEIIEGYKKMLSEAHGMLDVQSKLMQEQSLLLKQVSAQRDEAIPAAPIGRTIVSEDDLDV